jgi:hypothetical protein
MHTVWIAATTGLDAPSTRSDQAQQVGLGQRLGRAEFLDVGAARERLAGAGDDDGLDGRVVLRLLDASATALRVS